MDTIARQSAAHGEPGSRPESHADRETEPLSVLWRDRRLFFLDQTRLPEEVVREEQLTVEQVWDSIRRLKVRGAPAIGIAGAYGLLIGARSCGARTGEGLLARLDELAAYLNGSRPTAVNLSWALKRMVRAARAAAESARPGRAAAGIRRPEGDGAEVGAGLAPGAKPADTRGEGGEVEGILAALEREAEAIHREDRELCRGIGEAGLPLIREGTGVLTHCNAGALATSILGTATAPLYLAHGRGISFRVYADETRPLLQGSRLTAWELSQAGIDVTVICDDMAASLLASGRVDLVIVGTDRVAANGDVANKIGTLGVALLARHFGIPFYVACPSSTVDLDAATGASIPIEERDAEEVRFFGARRTAPAEVKVWNPAFDITPHDLVTGLITERGILRAPYEVSLRGLGGAR